MLVTAATMLFALLVWSQFSDDDDDDTPDKGLMTPVYQGVQ